VSAMEAILGARSRHILLRSRFELLEQVRRCRRFLREATSTRRGRLLQQVQLLRNDLQGISPKVEGVLEADGELAFSPDREADLLPFQAYPPPQPIRAS
jgi:hypothetical protein